MLSWLSGIWGKIAGIALLIGGLIAWLMLRDAQMMRKGAEKLKAQQQKKLAQERQKRDENEDDIRTTPDADLDAELRERRRP